MQDRSLLPAILLTVVAGVLFSCMDGVNKHLSAALPVLQIVWGRYLFHTLLVGGYLAATTGTRFLKTRRPGLQLLRGLTLLGSTGCMYQALSFVPLADATAVLFFAPILVTLLSVIFLGERIGWPRIGAIVAGFCGMLLILRPGFSSIHPALALALVAAFFNATYLLLTRRLSGQEDAAATQFNTTAVGAVLTSLLAVAFWQTPTPGQFALMMVSGGLGALGHFLLVGAFSRAPASLLSPFLYSQVIGAGTISLAVFGDPLHLTTLLGTAILVASGLVIWMRENRRRPAGALTTDTTASERPTDTTVGENVK